LRISEGLVVTPSTRPVAARSAISAMSAVSRKNFIPPPSIGCPAFPYLKFRARSRLMQSDSKPREIVAVMVPMPAPAPYSYKVPEGMECAPGDIVEVPLGPRRVCGIVWDGGAEAIDPARLKPVLRRFDVP